MSVTCNIPPDQLTDFKKIGQGASATIYSAIWRLSSEFNGVVDEPHTSVAVKVFKDEDNCCRDELEKLTKLNQNNIVKFFGETTFKGRNALVIELAERGSLDKLIDYRSLITYTVGDVLRWLVDIAEGVCYLHQQKIIHRDLKPQNLLLFNTTDSLPRTVKITDFGVSREKETPTKTMTAACGTWLYAAPEVLRGERYDQRCDVFSFGTIAWQTFSRQNPFSDLTNNFQVIYAVGVEGQRPRPRRPEGCPKPVQSLIIKCWREHQKKILNLSGDRPKMSEVKKDLIEINNRLAQSEKSVELCGLGSNRKSFVNARQILKTVEIKNEIICNVDGDDFFEALSLAIDKLEPQVKPINRILLSELNLTELPQDFFGSIAVRQIHFSNCKNYNDINSEIFNSVRKSVDSIVWSNSRGDNRSHSRCLENVLFFNRFSMLKMIIIGSVDYVHLSSNCFDQLTHLSMLTIQYCKRLEIDEFAFFNNKNMSEFRLISSKIDKIKKNAFTFKDESDKLCGLNFNNNQLTCSSFASGAFDNINRPTVINLSRNQIEYLEASVFEESLNNNLKNQIIVDGLTLDQKHVKNDWMFEKEIYFVGKVRLLIANCNNWIPKSPVISEL